VKTTNTASRLRLRQLAPDYQWEGRGRQAGRAEEMTMGRDSSALKRLNLSPLSPKQKAHHHTLSLLLPRLPSPRFLPSPRLLP
jgi:hypothetical protein